MVFLERSAVGHVRIHLSAVAAVLASHNREKPTVARIGVHAATAAVRRVLRRRRRDHGASEFQRKSVHARQRNGSR